MVVAAGLTTLDRAPDLPQRQALPFPPMSPELDDLQHFYQPIASLGAAPAGWSEALVRWRLADGTVRGPLDILPYWLAPGRREAFTHFTLLRAAQALATNPGVSMSINLTPGQLLLPVTLCTVTGMLESVTRRLYVEVVEAQPEESPALARQLAVLRERCGAVLLDDVTPTDLDGRLRFGTPVDGVKLDRSVVRAALYSEGVLRDGAQEFIQRARDRFEFVVAEGVEDASACEALKALGASHVQGFGIAKPEAELRTSVTITSDRHHAERQVGTKLPAIAGRTAQAPS